MMHGTYNVKLKIFGFTLQINLMISFLQAGSHGFFAVGVHVTSGNPLSTGPA
jgi:hypothetical protein